MNMPITSGSSDPTYEYEEYRNVVIKSMEDYILEIHEDIRSIKPIFGRVFEKAAADLMQFNDKLNLTPSLTLKRLKTDSIFVLKGMLKQSSKFAEAKRKIDTLKAIFVVGAGLSFESDVPMSKDLKDILNFVEASDFSFLRADPIKCNNFKNQFKILLSESEPGPSHKLIASNFPSKIMEIICLNWDDLIERAFKDYNKYPKKINKESDANDKNHLWKFHGDVEEFDIENVPGQLGWVFPDEDGYVFDCFKNYMKDKLNSTLFCLFVVGYSENEHQIQTVINQLEKQPPRPTYRIGMAIEKFQDDFYLIGPSAYVLKRILN